LVDSFGFGAAADFAANVANCSQGKAQKYDSCFDCCYYSL
jgi:hypothetical protein